MIGTEFNQELMHHWTHGVMPNPDFDKLHDRLLRSGVAPRHVARAISELRDHVEDIYREAIENGVSREAAMVQASERIGVIESIAQQYRSKPELKCWVYRHPRMARVVLPIACVMILPAIPFYAGVENAPLLARWCACLLLSALVTATMLLVMHLSIAVT